MNVSFAKNAPSAATAVVDVAATVTPQPAPVAPVPALAPAPTPVAALAAAVCGAGTVATIPQQPVEKSNGLGLKDYIPEFKDIILPRLNIVQNIGELKDSFPLGSIVFNQTTVLFSPPVYNEKAQKVEKEGTPPVIITCLGFRPTRFVEKAEGGRGMIVNTEEEVAANGGTLDYNEWKLKETEGIKYFQPLAEALIAVERPAICADDDTVFVYPVEGKKFALALWAMKGTAYTAAAKRVFFTARQVGSLRGGYPTRSFAFTSRWQKFGATNGAHVPVLVPYQPSSPVFMAWVANVMNPQSAPAGAE